MSIHNHSYLFAYFGKTKISIVVLVCLLIPITSCTPPCPPQIDVQSIIMRSLEVNRKEYKLLQEENKQLILNTGESSFGHDLATLENMEVLKHINAILSYSEDELTYYSSQLTSTLFILGAPINDMYVDSYNSLFSVADAERYLISFVRERQAKNFKKFIDSKLDIVCIPVPSSSPDTVSYTIIPFYRLEILPVLRINSKRQEFLNIERYEFNFSTSELSYPTTHFEVLFPKLNGGYSTRGLSINPDSPNISFSNDTSTNFRPLNTLTSPASFIR